MVVVLASQFEDRCSKVPNGIHNTMNSDQLIAIHLFIKKQKEGKCFKKHI
jgi:hypothetical protein